MSMCSVSVNVQYLDASGAHRGPSGAVPGGGGGAGGGGTAGGGGGATLEYHALPPPPPPSPAPHALALNHGLVALPHSPTVGHPAPQAQPVSNTNTTPAHRQLATHQHHIQLNNPHHLHQLHQVGEDAASARWSHYQQLWRQHQIILNGKTGGGKESPEQKKDDPEVWSQVDAHAAFLGPNIWEKALPYESDLKYVDLDEFLRDNGIPMDAPSAGSNPNPDGLGGGILPTASTSPQQPPANGQPQPQPQAQLQPQQLHKMQALSPDPDANGNGQDLLLPDASLLLQVTEPSLTPLRRVVKRKRSPSPCDPMTPMTLNPPSPADSTMSLASSSRDFDPRTRPFSDEELKPQPMIKKSRKQTNQKAMGHEAEGDDRLANFVPDGMKDEKYWARRRKNNMAAKRSRDARRMKENQIALRAGYLEKENMGLLQEIERLRKENLMLLDQASKVSCVCVAVSKCSN